VEPYKEAFEIANKVNWSKEEQKMAILDPRVDIAFKKLFGDTNNKGLLISLINSIVSEKDQVEYIPMLKPS